MNIQYKFMVFILSATALVACADGKEDNISKTPVKIACTWDTTVQLSYEERRLETPLPFSGENVVGRDQTPLAVRIIKGAGFEQFISNFKISLCGENGLTTLTSFEQAQKAVNKSGREIWFAAVDRAQAKRALKNSETLPYSDDRMLYWSRVQMTKILRQWSPSFHLTQNQKEQLQWEFEKSSRGQNDINLPQGKTADGKLYRRMIISGFDVFTLGTPGQPDIGLRNGNPSAAIALALDGKEFTLSDGSILHIESYILPVNYDPFIKSMQEDTLGPWFKKGPKRVDASITLSQGRDNIFSLEEYNGRFHGTVGGNDGISYCLTELPKEILPLGTQTLEGTNPISQVGSGCNIVVQKRWYSMDTTSHWVKNSPPQFIKASLPHEKMLLGHSQNGIVRPIGASSEGLQGFDVEWNIGYEYFPDCSISHTIIQAGSKVVNRMPDPSLVKDPNPMWCSRNGSGGDYLSNESAYRNTLLRDVMGLKIPAGHIHTPIMNRYFNGNPDNGGGIRDDNAITDARFENYRTAIVGQSINLLKIVGESLVK